MGSQRRSLRRQRIHGRVSSLVRYYTDATMSVVEPIAAAPPKQSLPVVCYLGSRHRLSRTAVRAVGTLAVGWGRLRVLRGTAIFAFLLSDRSAGRASRPKIRE